MKFKYEYLDLREFEEVIGLEEHGEVNSFDKFLLELTIRGDSGWELCGFEYRCAFFKKAE